MTSKPKKTRELQNHHMDSTRWNEFVPRDGDIIVATYAKSGTTWVQQILGQIIFNGDPTVRVANLSPWLDLRVAPLEEVLKHLEEQTTQRFIKTHLPVDALTFHENCKYVYITRDGRDVVWSLYNHLSRANDKLYDAMNNTPGRVGPELSRPSEDVLEFWKEWLDEDGSPLWSFWDSIKTWWEVRNLPNVLVLHYADLKKDLPGNIRKISEFIKVPIDEEKFETITEHCTFEWMKANGNNIVPLNGIFWEGGASTFINKGVNRRWAEILPESESERYETMAKEKLGEECAAWLNRQ